MTTRCSGRALATLRLAADLGVMRTIVGGSMIMRTGRAYPIIAVLAFAACGQPEVASMPTPPSPVGSSVSLQLIIDATNRQGPGLAPPISVHLIARDALGHGVAIVGGELVVRDSEGV